MERKPLVEDRYDWGLLSNEREKICRELRDIEDREQQAQMRLETLFPRPTKSHSQHSRDLEWERISAPSYGNVWAEHSSLGLTGIAPRTKRVHARDVGHDQGGDDVDAEERLEDKEEGGWEDQQRRRWDEEVEEEEGDKGMLLDERTFESSSGRSFEGRTDEPYERHIGRSRFNRSGVDGRASEQLDEFWRKESVCWEGTDHRTHTFLLEQENSRIRESLKFLKEEEDAVERRLDRYLGPVALASTGMPSVSLRSRMCTHIPNDP
jgi:hypothetical protein